MPVTVKEINTYSEIGEIRSAWIELRQAIGNERICTHPDWIHATQFVPNQGKLIILTAFDGDTLIGLAPMLLRDFRYRGIRLRKIEFVGHTPVNDFLVRERREEIVRAFLHRLCGRGRERPWDFLELARIRREESTLQPIRDAIRGLGLRPYEIEDHRNAICVTDDWDAYVARRSKNFMKELRGRENRLERLGNVSFMRYSGLEDRLEDPASPRKLERMFQAAIECAGNSWQGQAKEGAALSDEKSYGVFFREIIYSFASMNMLLLHVLFSGDVPIAFDLSFLDGQLITDYKTGYHQGFKFYGPGAHMFKTVLEYACARGVPYIDLMGIEKGQEYKYRLADETHRTTRVTAFNRTVNGSLARFVMKGLAPSVKRLVRR